MKVKAGFYVMPTGVMRWRPFAGPFDTTEQAQVARDELNHEWWTSHFAWRYEFFTPFYVRYVAPETRDFDIEMSGWFHEFIP